MHREEKELLNALRSADQFHNAELVDGELVNLGVPSANEDICTVPISEEMCLVCKSFPQPASEISFEMFGEGEPMHTFTAEDFQKDPEGTMGALMGLLRSTVEHDYCELGSAKHNLDQLLKFVLQNLTESMMLCTAFVKSREEPSLVDVIEEAVEHLRARVFNTLLAEYPEDNHVEMFRGRPPEEAPPFERYDGGK